MSKRTGIKRGKLSRSISVSLAGLRAGGAFALDGAVKKLRGTEGEPLSSPFVRREAHRFVAELGRLKGTYVKIGQMLALLGEHFLPPVLTEALHQLESQTQPLPYADIEAELRSVLGDRMDELQIEHEAIAAASLSQVHRARIIASGEQICLKIQYPGLAEVIDSDFDTVVNMLMLARWVKAGRDLDEWLAAMREQLHQEIDYQREAEMGDKVSGFATDTDSKLGRYRVTYHVPKRYPRYCCGTVLAMEYVSGHLVTQPEVAGLSQARRNALGSAMLELFFNELYQWGVLQTDANFGNYLIRSSQHSDDIVLLDFGSILSCDDNFLLHLGNTIAAGQSGDRSLLVSSLIGLGCLQEHNSELAKNSFSDFCLELLEPLRAPEDLPSEHLNDKGQYSWGSSRLMRRVGKKAAASAATLDFTAPSREFAMIARKLTGVFTFISVLNAEFNGHDIAHRHIEQWRQGH
jgi:predicted unusual protein kinase regulating ubiquinone biosynthesis (AarF/ABC1/UbiB family)